MNFDEKTAIEIIEKYNLAKNTLGVWRTRNAIPDKYFRENFKIEQKVSGERDEQMFKDFKKITEYKKINIQALRRLAGISESRFRDVMYNSITLKKNEIVELKKAINILRIEAKECLEAFSQGVVSDLKERKLKSFLKRTEVKTLNLFDSKRDVYNKFDGWMMGRRSFPIECKSELQHALLVFITETTML